MHCKAYFHSAQSHQYGLSREVPPYPSMIHCTLNHNYIVSLIIVEISEQSV